MRPARVGRMVGRPIGLLALIGLISAFLTACGGGRTPPPPPTQLVTLPPAATRAQRLPPTWTLAPTRTPAPTITPLPSPTRPPTASVSDVCGAFRLLRVPAAELEFDGVGRFVWQGVPRGAGLVIAIRLEGRDTGLRLELPVEGSGTFDFSLMRLPEAGLYNWQIALRHPFYGEICAQTGRFTRKPPIMP